MERKIYTVAKINEEIKLLLEGDFIFSSIMVQGEVTSLNKHYTGHYYFKLRDQDGSILSCVMFSSYSKLVPDLKNGDEVICYGSISVYEKGGTYSLNVRKIEQSGLGKYLIELKQLETRLEKEGYFSLEKKKIPYFPTKIAILTASSGAAICDVVSTIQRKCRTGIYIFPCLVQGKEAAKSIINALESAAKINPDVIIITRGGGSKDDLYAFNDEELVKKIALCNIATITAVGHSIDSSLVDKVSSLACITPTDAGNAVILTYEEYLSRINICIEKINNYVNQKIVNLQTKILNIERVIESYSPKNKFVILKEKLSLLNNKSDLLINNYLDSLSSFKSSIKLLDKSIEKVLTNKIMLYKQYLGKLDALNPLNLLLKGYSLTYFNKKIISSYKEVKKDDEIKLELKDGIVYANVTKTEARKWEN